MLLRRGWPLVALLACSGPAPSDAGADAGSVGGDAGTDAGRDAGVDAGRDAGFDGGPDDPGWEPWVTIEACTFERARNPAGVIQVEWAPCPSGIGPAGCLGPAGPRLLATAGWFDAGRGYFLLSSIDSRDRVTITLMSVDNPAPLAAWRRPLFGPGVCMLDVGIGGGMIAVVPGFFDDDTLETNVDQVFYGPIAEVNELEDPVAVISPGVQPQHVAVSAEVVAFWTGGMAIGVDPATGRWARLDEPLAGIPQNVQVVGAHVLWEDWADLVRIAHADLTATAAIFHRADPGDIKGFRTDGADMAWFEGYDRQPDGSYGRLELWTAPYTRDPAALAPRLVRPMDIRNGSAFGGGWYVVWRNDPRGYEIIDVRDGTRRWWLAPVSRDPLYVSEHEILADGLVRFDPHELPTAD